MSVEHGSAWWESRERVVPKSSNACQKTEPFHLESPPPLALRRRPWRPVFRALGGFRLWMISPSLAKPNALYNRSVHLDWTGWEANVYWTSMRAMIMASNLEGLARNEIFACFCRLMMGQGSALKRSLRIVSLSYCPCGFCTCTSCVVVQNLFDIPDWSTQWLFTGLEKTIAASEGSPGAEWPWNGKWPGRRYSARPDEDKLTKLRLLRIVCRSLPLKNQHPRQHMVAQIPSLTDPPHICPRIWLAPTGTAKRPICKWWANWGSTWSSSGPTKAYKSNKSINGQGWSVRATRVSVVMNHNHYHYTH